MTNKGHFYCNNQDDNVVRLFIIRHGQTDENVNKIIQGHMDTALNPVGLQQAEQLGRFLKAHGVQFDRVVCSDLRRCRETIGKVLAHYAVAPKTELTAGLRERHMGEVEGMYVEDAEQYARQLGHASFRELGETEEALEQRVAAQLRGIVAAGGGRNVAVVTHGGAIRQLLRWLGCGTRFTVYNTSVTVVDYTLPADAFAVRMVGSTQHLGEGQFLVNDSRLR
ncbi:AaceriAFR554Wp [[Ashbya] aceris (nom. inval.)]|nr:AaceriAFR554Wp [[Ashbya] aceris (nom. inval.)]